MYEIGKQEVQAIKKIISKGKLLDILRIVNAIFLKKITQNTFQLNIPL